MDKIIENITEPQYVMWIFIAIIVIISKFCIGLNYISVLDIISNHLNCFRNQKGKLLIAPVIDYLVLPFFMGAATAGMKSINDASINIITVIVSILTAMLFTMLTMVIDMNGKIKENAGPVDKLISVITYIVFALFSLICIYPFYYIFINTISANDLSEKGKIIFWPQQIHFRNYLDATKIPGLLQAAQISIARTLIGTACTVLLAGFLGYMFTRETMWKRKLWYRFVVLTMYFNAGIIPWYITMNNLHLTNNFLGYILPTLVSPFYIILTKTYVESIPRELQDAAEVDGAGTLKVFFSIILPIIKPILATVAIFAAVGQWNSFQDTLLLVTDTKLYTLQFILYQYINQASSLATIVSSGTSSEAIQQMLATTQTATSIRMTVTILVVTPILLVYPFFQRFFVKGIMIGAVKG